MKRKDGQLENRYRNPQVVEMLHQLLADLDLHSINIRGYHWNIRERISLYYARNLKKEIWI